MDTQLFSCLVSHKPVVRELEDEQSICLPPNSCGFGFIVIGDAEEYAWAYFSSTGNSILIANSNGIINSDTDGKFCIFPEQNCLCMKNRLGSKKCVKYFFRYC